MDESKVLKLIRTSGEKEELINLIEKLVEETYKDKFDETSEYSSDLGKKIWDEISLEISSRGISNNRREIEKYLNTLLEKIRTINSLKLTLAISPSEELITALSKWVEKNLSEKIIFDIKVDPKIIGGAIITSDKGEFADFSLLKKINLIFKAKKSIVSE